MTQTQRRTPAAAIASVAIAASLIGGIVGGAVGNRVELLIRNAADASARHAAAEQAKWDAYGAQWLRLNQAQQSRYLTAHDQDVLKQAEEWEARYRQMYPGSN